MSTSEYTRGEAKCGTARILILADVEGRNDTSEVQKVGEAQDGTPRTPQDIALIVIPTRTRHYVVDSKAFE